MTRQQQKVLWYDERIKYLSDKVLDENDPHLKQEICKLIEEYLTIRDKARV